MSEAPERIWAFPKKDWFNAGASTNRITAAGAKDVEYLRADHVDALLKAEREKALREAAEEARHYGHESYAAMMISDAIIDLTKKDATDG